jgi:hypothetical protein
MSDFNKTVLDLFPGIEDLRDTLATNPDHQWKKRDPKDIRGIVFHQELGWSSVEDVAKYHTGPKSHLRQGGVHSISYTFAIRRDGSLCLCNDLENKTWSQGMRGNDIDENAAFLGIMFEGMFRGEGVTSAKAGEPTLAQIKTGIQFWETMRDFYKLPNECLYGHYHWGKPACPGNTLQTLIESIRADEDVYRTPEPEDLAFTTPKSRQAGLHALGYSIGVDGIWGNGSKSTLKKFQADQGIGADGLWGPTTEKTLEKALAEADAVDKMKALL